MDMSTTYMGFALPHPLIPGASPMVDHLDVVRQLEDAGAPMIVMHSLFEEQLRLESAATSSVYDASSHTSAEAMGYLPSPEAFVLGPDQYLEQIGRIKGAVAVPVIASLNGATPGAWLSYASLIEQAGADGLELNIYDIGMNPSESSGAIEARVLEVVRTVRESVNIPLAVKLSPFFAGMAHLASALDDLNVDALLLFNRFYQPDIDVEQLQVHRVNLSHPSELLLRLRWIAALSGRVRASLGVTGGVHEAEDVVKAVMAGADGVQMVSALLMRGPEHLRRVVSDLEQWLVEHEYESLAQMRGSMNMQRCPDPSAYERGNYIQILQTWSVMW
jgi:dihydroorotate dehydrogenase (fumarate)